jgi:hypothetical protein
VTLCSLKQDVFLVGGAILFFRAFLEKSEELFFEG